MSWNMYVLQIRTFMELFHTNEPLNVKIGLNFISLQQYTIYNILLLYILRPLYNFLADFALYFSIKLFFNSFSWLLIQQSIVYQLKSLKTNVFNYLTLFLSLFFSFVFFSWHIFHSNKEICASRVKKEKNKERIYLCFMFYVCFSP